MKPFVLRKSQVLPVPLEEVFAFFQDPSNLARVTPAELGFRILTPPPLKMREGAVIDYTIRTLGLPVRWTTIITDYDPPHGFADLQLRGPYAYWHHTHTFRAAAGGTEMTDTVHYLLPGGPVGPLVHRLFVKRQLDRIFTHRAEVIASMFPARSGREGRPAPAEKRSIKKRAVGETGVARTDAMKPGTERRGLRKRTAGIHRRRKGTARKPAPAKAVARRRKRKSS